MKGEARSQSATNQSDSLLATFPARRARAKNTTRPRTDRGAIFRRSWRTDSASAVFFVRRIQDNLWVEPFAFAVESAHPAPNRGGRFPAQLLIRDRFGQRVEWPHQFVRDDIETARPRDQRGEARIGFCDMINRLLHQ